MQRTAAVLNYIPNKNVTQINQRGTRNNIALEDYGRRSWCVSVDNATLLTRRNGCVAVVGNSHRHRYIEVRAPSRHGYTIGLTTPGWQGPTPFTRKIAGGRQSEPQVGGILIRQGDVDLYTRAFVVGMSRESEIIATEATK